MPPPRWAGGAPSARRARAEGAGGARGNASVLARRQSSNGSASSTPRCRARKLPSWCAAGKRSASTISIEPMRTAPVSVTSAPSTATLYETAEPRRSPDRAPERQALELRLHLAARMHELGIIDAQPAGADQRQVLDAGRIGERYEDVRLLHLGVIDSLVRQDHVRTRGPAARFRPVGL